MLRPEMDRIVGESLVWGGYEWSHHGTSAARQSAVSGAFRF